MTVKNKTRTVLHASAADVARFGKKEEEGAASIAEMMKSLKEMQKGMSKKDDQVSEFVTTAVKQIEAIGKMTDDTKAALEKSVADALAMQKRYDDLEQLVTALKKQRGDGLDARKSLGQRAVESDDFKAMAEKGETFKGRVSFKAISEATTGAGGIGDIIQPTRVGGIIRPEDRRMVIRDLLSAGRTASNAVEYVRETGFTNNAAIVPETTLKPESSLDFTVETVPVVTIAHWMAASKQVLADVPMLMSYIDSRLRYGLDLKEEEQLLSGDGTGGNIYGLIPQATPYDTARSRIGDTRIDTIRRAMTQVRLSEYRATGIVLHPSDWEEIELTKDDTGDYIWANPRGLLGPTLWGLPVIDTLALEEGEFLVGAFKQAATVWDREQSNVEVSTEDRDNFVKNMVTIRAEERLALTVFRPEAVVYGDFDGIVST